MSSFWCFLFKSSWRVCLLTTEIEEVFVPMFDEIKGEEQELKLSKHFTGSKWEGNCNNGIDMKPLDFIDDSIKSIFLYKQVKVKKENFRSHVNLGFTSKFLLQRKMMLICKNFTDLKELGKWKNRRFIKSNYYDRQKSIRFKKNTSR